MAAISLCLCCVEALALLPPFFATKFLSNAVWPFVLNNLFVQENNNSSTVMG